MRYPRNLRQMDSMEPYDSFLDWDEDEEEEEANPLSIELEDQPPPISGDSFFYRREEEQ